MAGAEASEGRVSRDALRRLAVDDDMVICPKSYQE